MLGPRAAIGDGRSGVREFDAGAIDEPGAGRVHALKSGKIEDHALRVLAPARRAKPRPPPARVRRRRSTPRPAPGRRRPGRLLRVTEGVVVTKRSGQAETALISRGPAPCRADTRAPPRRGIRAKTNQVRIRRPGDRDSDSRTKRVESLCRPAQRPSGLSLRRRPFLSRPAGSEPWFAARAKRQRISHLPNRRPPAKLCRARSDDVKSGCRNLASPRASLPQSGTGAKGPGTNGAENRRRAASPDSARRKATANPGAGRGRCQVMVAKGLSSDDGGASQSIIAALRMQTMVACAGLSLRLRMRWGISQR